MAKYNDDARFLANLVKDKNKMKASIAGSANVVQVGKRSTESFNVEVFDIKVTPRSVVGEGIWSNADYGIWGTSKWTEERINVGSLTSLRKFQWNTETDLSAGTYDGNIDISQGDVRLA